MRVFALVFFSIMLSSCNSTQKGQSLGSFDNTKYGGILLSLDTIGEEFLKINQFSVQQVEDGSTYTATPVFSSSTKLVLFVSAPPGSYHLSRLLGMSQGAPFKSTNINGGKTINVQTGGILDIGNLVLRSVRNNKLIVMEAKRANQLQNVINEKFINRNLIQKGIFAKNQIIEFARSSNGLLVDYPLRKIGLTEDKLSRLKRSEKPYEELKDMVLPNGDFFIKENGEGIAGSWLGVIFEYEDGRIFKKDTGSGLTLIADKIENYWLAVSELGSIYYSNDDAVTWNATEPFFKNELVMKVACQNTQYCIVLTTNIPDYNVITSYKYRLGANEKPTKIHSMDTKTAFGVSWGFDERSFYLFEPSTGAVNINTDTLESTFKEIDFEFDFIFFNSTNHSFTAIDFSNKNSAVAFDTVDSWTKFKAPSESTGQIFFDSEKIGYTHELGEPIKLHKTTDGGKTWVEHRALPNECKNIYHLYSSTTWLCQTWDGDLVTDSI